MGRTKSGSVQSPPLISSTTRTVFRNLRRLRHFWGRQFSLSQRLIAGSVVTVAIAMLILGHLAGQYVTDAITKGVAATAAASIDSLTAWHLRNLQFGQKLSPEERERIAEILEVGSDVSSTSLLQFRVHGIDGTLYYDSADGLLDEDDPSESIMAAAEGRTIANIRDVALGPVGPLQVHPIKVLKIYSPLHARDTGQIFGIAEMYYSAGSVVELQAQAQKDVWLAVGVLGVAVSGILYLLINNASQLIVLQRMRLARNLNASRTLAKENRALHAASEELRASASSSNESLLAQVGTDIHDGPLQMLTLATLRLTPRDRPHQGDREEIENAATVKLVTDAIDELRRISTGLALPELADLDVENALRLAVRRHEQMTGTLVRHRVEKVPVNVSITVKTCAYRIVQEALNNAYRHGGAAEQSVDAEFDNGWLRIEVSNRALEVDIRPMPASGAAPLGLRGMRFRVESLGGKLHVELGRPRSRIVAELPAEAAAAPTQ